MSRGRGTGTPRPLSQSSADPAQPQPSKKSCRSTCADDSILSTTRGSTRPSGIKPLLAAPKRSASSADLATLNDFGIPGSPPSLRDDDIVGTCGYDNPIDTNDPYKDLHTVRRQLREMQAWRVCVDEALHGIGADSVKTEKLRHRIQVLEDTVEHERAERRHLELRMKKAEGLIADTLEKNRAPDLPRAIMDNIDDEKVAAAIAAAEKAIENDQHDPEPDETQHELRCSWALKQATRDGIFRRGRCILCKKNDSYGAHFQGREHQKWRRAWFDNPAVVAGYADWDWN